MVVTTENTILSDLRCSLKHGKLKNPILENVSTTKTKPHGAFPKGSTSAVHSALTRNVLLEKLTKDAGSVRCSALKKDPLGKPAGYYASVKQPLSTTRNTILENFASMHSGETGSLLSNGRVDLKNPLLETQTKNGFKSITRNNLLKSDSLKITLRTSNTLLAPTFSLSKSAPPSRSAVENVSLKEKSFVTPEEHPVTPVTSTDLKKISQCIGEPELCFPSPEVIKQKPAVVTSKVDIAKADLISRSCTSLINNPIWFSEDDVTRQEIFTLSKNISESDPEFVLKIALYTRVELNIRATCNFLLAIAAQLPPCRPFLKKYFYKAIILPSDWIQVSEFHKSLIDPDGKQGNHSLPVALRKVMVTKFSNFDAYQLAKYNKDKSKNSKKKEKRKEKKEGKKDEKEEEQEEEESEKRPKLQVPSYTLKFLVRKLHIVKPARHVMCLLGKKYPGSVDEFYKCGLEGTWDSALSGKRMKLEIPETWETQVSAKGNVAKTWQDLLDHRKLPFMAMLRNLRNMIQAGISEKHHQQVLKTLTNERAVTRSRQFPFRFFSAYEVLKELDREIEKQSMYKQHGIKYFLNMTQKQHLKRKFGDETEKTDEAKHVDFIKRRVAKKYGKPFLYDEHMIKRYTDALNEAVRIATEHNVLPISGHTVVLCDISYQMRIKKCTTSKGIGSSRTLAEVGILLGLMCAYSCEACTFLICVGSQYKIVELEKGGILENMSRLLKWTRDEFDKRENFLPQKFLANLLVNRVKMDNLLLLSSALKDDEESDLRDFLESYKDDVNSSLLCYKVDLAGKRCSVESVPGVISFTGYSDQILKFIALGTAEVQLNFVSTIDKRLQLAELDDSSFFEKIPPVISTPPAALPWKVVKVFISSTLKDMSCERDVLVSRVFPLLREKAKELSLHVVETDLRWGITGEDTRHGRNVSICLQEVRNCDIFIGILGERYGWTPRNYGFSEEGYKWLEDYPKGRSITELEIAQAAFQRDCENKSCLFYLRDSSGIKSQISKSAKDAFFERDSKKMSKLKNLKNRILQSDHHVGELYSPKWDGIVNGQPKISDLEQFEEQVTADIWQKLKCISEKGGGHDNSEVTSDAHVEFALQKEFVARGALVSTVLRKLNVGKSSEGTIIGLVGSVGGGKTALLAHLYRYLTSLNKNSIICVHFTQSSVKDAQSPCDALRRICLAIAQSCNIHDIGIQNNIGRLVAFYKKLLKTLHQRNAVPVYLLLDELDAFESTDWISGLVQDKVTIIVTCTDGGSAHKALKHISRTSFVPIPELSISDKREVVRSALGKHSKKLDESHFNNQLQVLMSKKQSTNPMYLAIVCDTIRVQETFETLSDTLKRLPHDMYGALKWQLENTESKFTKTADLIPSIFGIIYCCDKWKILQNDLYEVLCFRFNGVSLSRAVVFSVLNNLRSFFAWSEGQGGQMLSLRQSVHRQVLGDKYLNDDKFVASCHSSLAEYYAQKCKGFCLENRENTDTFALVDCLIRLPEHLAKSGRDKILKGLLSEIEFVRLKCQLGIGKTLLEDFLPLQRKVEHKPKRKTKVQKLVNEPWEEMEKFVRSSLDIMINCPNMVYQEALNQRFGSSLRSSALDNHSSSDEGSKTSQMVCIEMSSYENKSSVPTQTYTNLSVDDVQTCLATFGKGQVFATGAVSGNVKIVQHGTGKQIVYTGHSDRISALCFIKKSILVSAAEDGTMIVWDINGGHKINTFKAHERKVSDIVVRPAQQGTSGQVFLSASHDRTIIIWGMSNWKMVKRISAGAPVNCMNFHPHEPRVAAGLWDASIRIWDVQTFKRIAVIRGHSKAVSSLQFSSCGVYIASCSKYETVVRLWAAKTGIPVGNFSEAYLTSSESLTFSADGGYLVGGGGGTNEESAQIAVWKSRLGNEEMKYEVDDIEEYGNATCCKYNASTSSLAVGFHEGYINIFDSRLPNPVHSEKIHDSAITCITWSPSREEEKKFDMFLEWEDKPEVVITGSTDHTLKAIDMESKCVTAIFEGHTAPVLASDCSDVWLASGGEDFSILLWDMNVLKPGQLSEMFNSDWSGMQFQQSNRNLEENINSNDTLEEITKVKHSKSLRGHEAPVTCIAFNSSENLLVSGARDGNICYWNLWKTNFQDAVANVQQQNALRAHKKDVAPAITIHQAHKDWITCCSWNDTSGHIVTGSNDSTLKIWKSPSVPLPPDLSQFETPLHTLIGHSSGITSVVYRMGCIVSTGGEDHSIRIWSHKGIEITSLDAKVKANCCDIAPPNLSEEDEDVDDNLEANEEMDWADEVEAVEWEEEHERRKPGAKKKRKTLASEMQNFDVVCAGNDASVVLWKPLAGHKVNILSEQAKSVTSLQICDGSQIFSQSSNGNIKLWNIEEPASEFPRQNGEATGIIAFSEGFITTCSAGYIYLWYLVDESQPSLCYKARIHGKRITGICSLGNSVFATASHDCSVIIWSVETMKKESDEKIFQKIFVVETLLCGHPLISLSYQDNSDATAKLWVGDLNGNCHKIEISSEKEFQLTPSCREVPQHCKVIGIVDDNSSELITNKGKIAEQEKLTLKVGEVIHCFLCTDAVSKQEKVMLFGSSFGYMYHAGDKSRKKIHDSRVTSILDCRDMFVTTSHDCTIKVWNKETWKQIGQFHTSSPISSAFMMSDRLMVYGDSSGMINTVTLHF